MRLNCNRVVESNVVIIGAGLAGLSAAAQLAPLRTTILSRGPLVSTTSTAWAQGGIAAAVGEDDSPLLHALDTVSVGGGICESETVTVVMNEAARAIEFLKACGTKFDADANGTIKLGLEAAHSRRRILHAAGDRSGFTALMALSSTVRSLEGISLREQSEVTELLVNSHGNCCGVVAYEPEGTTIYLAPAIVLATGGIGGLFQFTTNPTSSCGEGIALAALAGAKVADLEFVQFHPTALKTNRDPQPLLTEALRGEGAILINELGERFMESISSDAELAPRDVVARGIWRQLETGHTAYLDTRKALGNSIRERFPTVYAGAIEAGFDPTVEPIPVTPAAHYHMGGVVTNLWGKTSVPGLWAAGEVAATGLHGANRLASNSLLEAVVFGSRVAESIRRTTGLRSLAVQAIPKLIRNPQQPKPFRPSAAIRQAMWSGCGLERNTFGLRQALNIIESERISSLAKLTAKMIVTAALERRESRGAHFRSDYPDSDELQAQRAIYTFNSENRDLKREELVPTLRQVA